eukprot:Polyplicarium_translucidae@DN3184_c0_g1_i4.p2
MADGRPVIVASPEEYEGNNFALIVSDGAGGWTETSNPLLGEQSHRYFGIDKLGVISMMWSNNRISRMMDPASTEIQRFELARAKDVMIDPHYLWRTGNVFTFHREGRHREKCTVPVNPVGDIRAACSFGRTQSGTFVPPALLVEPSRGHSCRLLFWSNPVGDIR